MFVQIILVISTILQIIGLQPRISKKKSQSLEQFYLTVGLNTFGNKIQFLHLRNTEAVHALIIVEI